MKKNTALAFPNDSESKLLSNVNRIKNIEKYK